MATTDEINEAYRRLDGQLIPTDCPPGSVEEQLADQAVATIHMAVKWAKDACELRERRGVGSVPKGPVSMREALESCRVFFDTIDTLHAVEGGDQRFIRKAKMHCWLAKWEVVAALDGKPLEQVMREHVEQRINDQLSDEARAIAAGCPTPPPAPAAREPGNGVSAPADGLSDREGCRACRGT